MALKNNIKKQHVISGLDFDTDLTGLHKPEQIVDVLGKKVRFLAPSVLQKALMVKFLMLALQDMVSTEKERSEMSFDELYARCVKKLSELQGEVKTPEELQQRSATVGRMFASPDANEYLTKAIAQCFPDLSEPQNLTNEAFVQAATVLIESMKLE